VEVAMPIKSNSKINRKNEIKAELARIGSEHFSSFLPARIPTENIRKHRFGLSLLVVAVFTAAVGMYIPTEKPLNRAMFVIAAFVLALVGAHHLDRANKELRNHKNSKSSQ
jgi:hypothetical protein